MKYLLDIILIYMRVVTCLQKDYNGNEREVTYMSDWLGIQLMCMKVLTWLLKDNHANEIEESDVNHWLGSILL